MGDSRLVPVTARYVATKSLAEFVPKHKFPPRQGQRKLAMIEENRGLSQEQALELQIKIRSKEVEVLIGIIVATMGNILGTGS